MDSYHVGTTGSAKSVWIAARSGQGGKKTKEFLGSTVTRKLSVLLESQAINQP